MCFRDMLYIVNTTVDAPQTNELLKLVLLFKLYVEVLLLLIDNILDVESDKSIDT
jgi:hypothetical protein